MAAKVEKAYLALMPASSPGSGGLQAGLSGGSGDAVSGPAASALGTAAAMGDSVLGTSSSGGLGQLTLKFNPTSLKGGKTANWQRRPVPGAAQAGPPEFTGSGPRTLSFEILLDETDSPTGNVIKDVELLYSCCTPTPESRAAGRPSPPIVLFGWGHTMSFHAFVKSVSGTYEFFGPDGTVKAWKGSVELEEFPVGNPGTNPTSGGPPSRKTHVVTAGDSLANIAYREYGNPNLWRAVASANRIDDPMRLPPGTRLFIPGAAEASATV